MQPTPGRTRTPLLRHTGTAGPTSKAVSLRLQHPLSALSDLNRAVIHLTLSFLSCISGTALFAVGRNAILGRWSGLRNLEDPGHVVAGLR